MNTRMLKPKILIITLLAVVILSVPALANDLFDSLKPLVIQNLERIVNNGQGASPGTQQAIKVLTTIGNPSAGNGTDSYSSILRLAEEQYNSGNRDGSMDIFRKALQQLSRGSGSKSLDDALSEIGLFFKQKGDNSKALEYLLKAVDAKAATSDQAGLQNLLRQLEPLLIWQETGAGSANAMPETIPIDSKFLESVIKASDYAPLLIPGGSTSFFPGSGLSPGTAAGTRDGLSKASQAERIKAIPIPKYTDTGMEKVKAIPIPRYEGSGDKVSTVPIPKYTPSPEEHQKVASQKASTEKAPGPSATAGKEAPRNKAGKKKASGALTLSTVPANGVLTCAGPPAARNRAWEDLPVGNDFYSSYLNPVPGGRYAPYASDTGLDIVAPRGYPIYASKGGILLYTAPSGHVRQTGPSDDQGAMRVRHPDGTDTFYAHLSGRNAALKAGQRVAQGEWMGNIGTANRVPHLHFTIYHGYYSYVGPFATPGKLVNPWQTVVYNY
ncbi:MAG: M23 family metallopeptidase [Candidatus Eremiobacteraeota bacterium]|nr:M23 family metallopeptidase [Candidatus Eremiobacteraeota bacterium]